VKGGFRHVLGRIDLYGDVAPGAVKVSIRGRIADRVVISQVVGDVLHEILHFVEALRKVRLAAGDFCELLQIFLCLL